MVLAKDNKVERISSHRLAKYRKMVWVATVLFALPKRLLREFQTTYPG